MKQTRLLKLLVLFLLLTFSHATTLKQAVENALVNNPEVMSLQKNSEAYKLYIDEESAAYYPTLNLDAFLEKKNETKKPKDDVKTESKQNGYNAQIKLEQMIYDGGLTDAKVDEAKYDYQGTQIKNIATIENIIFEVAQSYLDLVKYKELLVLSQNNIAIHESYLETAIQSEEVSGETLDRIQVESKLFLATSKLFQQKDDKEVSLHSFNKLVGFEPVGEICKPLLNPTLIPTNVKDAVRESVKNSLSVLEQIENIKTQRAIVSQEKSRFLPSLTFEFQQEWDDDIDTADTETITDSAKLKLSYNFFNGYKDKATEQRERIFLQESQKILDDTVNIVEQEIKSSYSNYTNSLSKITYLKLYVEKTQEILDVYKEQFLGGTRTFIDILNSEAEVFSAKTQLIEEEYSLLTSYYEILLVLSKLSDTIVMQDNQICKPMQIDTNPQPLENVVSEKEDAVVEESDLAEIADLLEEDDSTTVQEKTDNADLEDIEQTLDLNEENLQQEVTKDRLVKDLVNDILTDVYDLNETDAESLQSQEAIEEKIIEQEANKILKVPTKKVNTSPSKTPAKKVVPKKTSKKSVSKPVTKKEEAIKPESALSKKDEKVLAKVINETQKKTINEKKLDKVLTQKIKPKEIKPFKTRFLNTNDENYTINLKTFVSHDAANRYVKQHKVLTDTFAYKFGRNLEFVKLINGIYMNYEDAQKELKKIQKQIPSGGFIIDTIKHQKNLYKKYNIRYKKPEIKMPSKNKAAQKEKEEEAKITIERADLKLEKIDNNIMSKVDFLKSQESDYTINVSTFVSIDELYTFMEDNSLGNRAFALRFGENQKLIKLVYGVYATRLNAQADYNKIKQINGINPVIEHIGKYKKLYAQNNNTEDELKSVLKILDAESLEDITDKTKKPEVRIEKSQETPKTPTRVKNLDEFILEKESAIEKPKSRIQVEKKSEKKSKKEIKKEVSEVQNAFIHARTKDATEKQLEIKQIKDEIEALENEIEIEKAKLDSQQKMKKLKKNENIEKLKPVNTQTVNIDEIKKENTVEKEIKSKERTKTEKIVKQAVEIEPEAINKRAKMEGIVFVDNRSTRSRSLPDEFVTSKSAYYTIMILDFRSMREAKGYIQRYGLNNNTVIFNYGRKYKVIHGAYRTFREANNAIKNLQPFVKNTKPYVRKISGYQELYKKYHKNSKKVNVSSVKKTSHKQEAENSDKKLPGITFANEKLKKEFLNKKSRAYTITLTTSPSFKEARWFRYGHNVQNNTITYKFRNQVKVIYGAYKSSREASKVIASFGKKLKKYKPFINRISTHQKLYQKYNKNIEE